MNFTMVMVHPELAIYHMIKPVCLVNGFGGGCTVFTRDANIGQRPRHRKMIRARISKASRVVMRLAYKLDQYLCRLVV